jgi:hypothetical protein
MKKLLIAGLFALSVTFGAVAHADAAPINCPGAQVATKTGDWWSCVNPADHENESGKDKNPNGHPNS